MIQTLKVILMRREIEKEKQKQMVTEKETKKLTVIQKLKVIMMER